MLTTMVLVATILLALHGLIHLMGTTVYMKLGTIAALPYKTTLLGGRWDLGERGMRAFGALWAVAAIGFVVAALALLAGWAWWQPALLAVALFSLMLTALDWSNAYAGALINILILAALWLGPRIPGWFS
jgi:hypothetical protein